MRLWLKRGSDKAFQKFANNYFGATPSGDAANSQFRLNFNAFTEPARLQECQMSHLTCFVRAIRDIFSNQV